jgi:hypothetical protein
VVEVGAAGLNSNIQSSSRESTSPAGFVTAIGGQEKSSGSSVVVLVVRTVDAWVTVTVMVSPSQGAARGVIK